MKHLDKLRDESYEKQKAEAFRCCDSCFQKFINSEIYYNYGWNDCQAEMMKVVEELKEALEFTLHCTSTIKWIVDGPKDITNPMFLGTLTREGDQEVHEKYLKAVATLAKLRELDGEG